MTEEEWLTSEHYRSMFEYMRRQLPGLRTNRGKRKFRLIASECVRRLPAVFGHTSLLSFLDVFEQFADGIVTRQQLEIAWSNVCHLPETRAGSGMQIVALGRIIQIDTRWAVSVWKLLTHTSFNLDTHTRSTPAIDDEPLPALVRDIFGNPFRPVSFEPNWRTSTVVSIDQGMYEARDFSPMPILADALQDAGCEHADILGHCRGSDPHVRGCWVVDLVLGKD